MAGLVTTDNGANVTSGSGALSPQQVRGIAYAAGFRGAALNTAVQIAGAESSFIPTNSYTPGPQESSHGLWQINVAPTANPQYANYNLNNPLVNAKIAFAMSKGGTDWSPWTTYTSGRYRSEPTGSGTGVVPGSSTGGAGAGIPSMSNALPTMPSAPSVGNRDAQILGSFLKETQSSANPFNSGIGGPKGAAIGGQSILGSGLLNAMKAPTPQHFAQAQSSLQTLAGGTPLKTHPAAAQTGSAYVNPIQGATIGRTDMGVDLNLPVGHPIRAIGDSKVINIYPNWYAGQPYVLLQLTNGPQAGKYYYVAEQIAPSVRPGQTVKAGQTIGTYASSGTGIEMGWGTPGWQTLAQAQGNTGGPGHSDSPAGQSFRNFLGTLGV